jgi:hypothetical protein
LPVEVYKIPEYPDVAVGLWREPLGDRFMRSGSISTPTGVTVNLTNYIRFAFHSHFESLRRETCITEVPEYCLNMLMVFFEGVQMDDNVV